MGVIDCIFYALVIDFFRLVCYDDSLWKMVIVVQWALSFIVEWFYPPVGVSVAVNSFSLSVVAVIFIQVAKQLSTVGVVLLSKPRAIVDGSLFTFISLESFHIPILVGPKCLIEVCIFIELIRVTSYHSFHIIPLISTIIMTVMMCGPIVNGFKNLLTSWVLEEIWSLFVLSTLHV